MLWNYPYPHVMELLVSPSYAVICILMLELPVSSCHTVTRIFMLWSNRYYHPMELPVSSCYGITRLLYGVTRIIMLWSYPYPHVME